MLLSALLVLLDSDDLRGRVSSVGGLHSAKTLGLLDLLFLRFFGSRVMTTFRGGVSEILSGNGRRLLLPRSGGLAAVQMIRK